MQESSLSEAEVKIMNGLRNHLDRFSFGKMRQGDDGISVSIVNRIIMLSSGNDPIRVFDPYRCG